MFEWIVKKKKVQFTWEKTPETQPLLQQNQPFSLQESQHVHRSAHGGRERWKNGDSKCHDEKQTDVDSPSCEWWHINCSGTTILNIPHQTNMGDPGRKRRYTTPGCQVRFSGVSVSRTRFKPLKQLYTRWWQAADEGHIRLLLNTNKADR